MHIRNARHWARLRKRSALPTAFIFVCTAAAEIGFRNVWGLELTATALCLTLAVFYYFAGARIVAVTLLVSACTAFCVSTPGDTHTFAEMATRMLRLPLSSCVLTVLVLIERLRRAQYEAALFAQVAASRYEMLLRADNDRLYTARSAQRDARLVGGRDGWKYNAGET